MKKLLAAIFHSPDMPSARPALDDTGQSSVPGLYVAGDLAGAPVVKLAMEQGLAVARHIVSQNASNVVVIGAGAAGLNAALELHAAGVRVTVIEKNRIGSTVADLPAGKWIYGEPRDRAPAGPLWFEEASKEDLVARWEQQVRDAGLNVRTGEAVTGLERTGRGFEVQTTGGAYPADRVILAAGKSGSPRELGVPGEDSSAVHYRLYNPKAHTGRKVVVVGGGNSAVEAAIALAERSDVTLSYRGAELHRITRENARRLAASGVSLRLGTRVAEFRPGECLLDSGEALPCDESFVLIGSEPPREFLRALGVRLENEWTGMPWLALGLVVAALLFLGSFGKAAWPAAVGAGAVLAWRGWRGDRFATLGAGFLLSYTIYGAKQSPGQEFWPFRGWGFEALSFFDRPWSFWYTVLYTALMTLFGVGAMKRWGFDRRDRFQVWRYASLLGFQWVFFFLIPEVLFRWAVAYQWVGASLAGDPAFAQQAWRSYGLVYAWPLFFYTFFGSPHDIWIVWGVVLSFVIIPMLALLHGKRYCSWICGCGGLAETVGDRWRHLAPKGRRSILWERMNIPVLIAAAVITLMMVGRDAWTVLQKPGDAAVAWYRLVADIWLVGIVPVALYPIFGGKIWCRYWCPLAKMMELFSRAFTRFKVSRFAIHANDKCIACGECTRYCQVGIDVMRFALLQRELNNANSSCIGCGICVTVCPMNVLSFAHPDLVQIEGVARAA